MNVKIIGRDDAPSKAANQTHLEEIPIEQMPFGLAGASLAAYQEISSFLDLRYKTDEPDSVTNPAEE